MLPSQTLLRSPSTRILAELQRDIFALTKPLKYIEANFDAVSQTDDTEDDLVESELQASGSTALAILLQVRADICRGITREGRVVRGCQNFLRSAGALFLCCRLPNLSREEPSVNLE